MDVDGCGLSGFLPFLPAPLWGSGTPRESKNYRSSPLPRGGGSREPRRAHQRSISLEGCTVVIPFPRPPSESGLEPELLRLLSRCFLLQSGQNLRHRADEIFCSLLGGGLGVAASLRILLGCHNVIEPKVQLGEH
jgi:hypothetical protein